MGKAVMVTGGSGYIGSWVVKGLLEKGYTVRVTVRDRKNTGKYEHLTDLAKGSQGRLEIWEADLLKEGSFDKAARGCFAVMHIASPFTLRFKDPQKELIEPALNGTRNVLSAATRSGTVRKVVLTSSVAAVHGDTIDMKEKGLKEFTEEHFNYSSSAKRQPYSFSKVLAEKEAWKMEESRKNWKLVVINPSFVVGPSLTGTTDSESLNFMKNILQGKFKMGAPELWFGFVDVRDVANAHILALENPKAAGRHILAERTMNMLELAGIIRGLFGDKYKLPAKNSPKLLMYLIGPMFGVNARFVRRNVGYPLKLNTSKSRNILGLTYTHIEKSIEDMVKQMHEMEIV
ncbi:MAG: NAD-dependent epimerase/dehydratase family protein [Bacteroidales bacterium]|nr:NAD-dependent epimerase/dehydratase family protein [Bacteroidales bacterium]